MHIFFISKFFIAFCVVFSCMAFADDMDDSESVVSNAVATPQATHTLSDEEALIEAVKKGDSETASTLLLKGVSANTADKEMCVLHIACTNGCERIVRELLLAGADVHKESSIGLSPLHFAAHQNHGYIASLLMLKGADMNGLKSGFCKSPLNLAYDRKSIGVLKIFSKHASTHLKRRVIEKKVQEIERAGVSELLSAAIELDKKPVHAGNISQSERRPKKRKRKEGAEKSSTPIEKRKRGRPKEVVEKPQDISPVSEKTKTPSGSGKIKKKAKPKTGDPTELFEGWIRLPIDVTPKKNCKDPHQPAPSHEETKASDQSIDE